jgi:hypothetical protein
MCGTGRSKKKKNQQNAAREAQRQREAAQKRAREAAELKERTRVQEVKDRTKPTTVGGDEGGEQAGGASFLQRRRNARRGFASTIKSNRRSGVGGRRADLATPSASGNTLGG